jgi:hypothetical protein
MASELRKSDNIEAHIKRSERTLRAVREGDRDFLQRLPQDRLIDLVLFGLKEAGKPGIERKLRWKPMGHAQPSRSPRHTEPVTRRVMSRLHAEIEILQLQLESERLQLESERKARFRLEVANSRWERMSAIAAIQRMPDRFHEKWKPFKTMTRHEWNSRVVPDNEQYSLLRDTRAVAQAMWAHNQDLTARIVGGYGAPYDHRNQLRNAFTCELLEPLENNPTTLGYFSDRRHLIEEMNRLRRLLGSALGGMPVRASADGLRGCDIGIGTGLRDARLLVESQSRRIRELMLSNEQAYVTTALMEREVRRLRQELPQPRRVRPRRED